MAETAWRGTQTLGSLRFNFLICKWESSSLPGCCGIFFSLGSGHLSIRYIVAGAFSAGLSWERMILPPYTAEGLLPPARPGT